MKAVIEISLDDELWGEYKDGIDKELFLEDLFSNWHGKDGVESVNLITLE